MGRALDAGGGGASMGVAGRRVAEGRGGWRRDEMSVTVVERRRRRRVRWRAAWSWACGVGGGADGGGMEAGWKKNFKEVRGWRGGMCES